MKRALIVLFVLAPIAVVFMLPLYAIGAFAATVWYSLAIGWDIGAEGFLQFVKWGQRVTSGRAK